MVSVIDSQSSLSISLLHCIDELTYAAIPPPRVERVASFDALSHASAVVFS